MQFERARKNTGWCPNTPTVRTAPVILVSDPAADYSLDPAGGAGGSERIYRGAHIAMGSFKTLMDNKKLLWFSFLAGMVMVFLFTAEFFLHVLGTYPYPAIAYPATLVLIFGVELITILCINFLLAGLIVKLSPALSDRRETIREGISRVRSIAVWSAILAFAGTALIAVMRPVRRKPLHGDIHGGDPVPLQLRSRIFVERAWPHRRSVPCIVCGDIGNLCDDCQPRSTRSDLVCHPGPCP